MSASLVLVVAVGVIAAAGVHLLLRRSLIQVLLGVVLLGNAVNVLLLVASGPAGEPPLIGVAEPEEMSDPLPQAMALTAIVITFGITAFLLAMAYRSWQLRGTDEVPDDAEDARVAEQRQRDDVDATRWQRS